jgi:hypothetical protein
VAREFASTSVNPREPRYVVQTNLLPFDDWETQYMNGRTCTSFALNILRIIIR